MRDYKYLILGFTLLAAYFIILNWVDINVLSTIFVTAATIIGGIAIWIQLKRDKDIKEAEFIISYNNMFLENTAFTQVERELERYKKELITDDDLKKIDSQSLINYLVYLEALATLILKGVLKFDNIDNLLSYRFFLATNNKIVQEIELVPEREFYKGIFELHKKWTEFKVKKDYTIILKETSLNQYYD